MSSDRLHTNSHHIDHIATALAGHTNRVAFRQDGHEATYGEVKDLIERMAGVLDRLEVRGRTAATLAGNRFEAWCAQVAVQMSGGRSVPLSTRSSLEDQSHICADAEVGILIVEAPFAAQAKKIAESVPSISTVLCLGSAEGTVNILDLVRDAEPLHLSAHRVASDDVIHLVYTSGTTGKPKGVMHTANSQGSGTLMLLAACDFPSPLNYLACAPITHAAGLLVVPTLMRGGTVTIHSAFDPTEVLDAISNSDITCTFLVPSMIYALLDAALGEERPLRSSLRMIMYGGSPMASARLQEAVDTFGPVLTQVFGQAECLSGMVMTAEEHDASVEGRLLACGRPMPGTVIAILDDELNEVETGQVGEICLRSQSAMDGYWKQPDETEKAFRGGWLHTGDLGSRDRHGFITIVDRLKDMIITGGVNVFPKVVEDVLCEHPAVAAAAVFAVPDEKWGEAVRAAVILRPGHTVDPEELRALVRSHKGGVWAPKTVDIVAELPLTAVGKVDKRRLRAPHWEGAGRMVS